MYMYYIKYNSCTDQYSLYMRYVHCMIVGTLFLEVWKRKNASLAYEWDVDTFEVAEMDRPEFVPTKQRPVCTIYTC